MAREAVRGISSSWSRNLYGFALRPDIVFYLDVDPNELVHRVFKKNSYLDYYESGTDLRLSDNMLESFVMYQKLLRKEFKRMQKRYNIVSINGNRSVSEINEDLQKRIDAYLQNLQNY
jgi:dTMP kinase